MKKSLQIMLFPGFYGTWYDPSDPFWYEMEEEARYYNEECRLLNGEPHTWVRDDFDYDYNAYQRAVCEEFISALKENVDLDIIRSIEYDYLYSPRYYNYENDHLYAIVEFTDDWREKMHNFMVENYDILKERIKRNWSSYDGFISSMSNDIDDWFTKLFEVEEDDIDTRYLEVMVYYMMVIGQMEGRTSGDDAQEMYDKTRDKLSETLFEDTWENIYLCEYIFIPAEKKVEETV